MDIPSLLLYLLLVALAFLVTVYLLRPRPLPGIPVTPSLPLFGHSLALILHFIRYETVTPFIEQFPALFGDRQLSQILMSFNDPL